MRDWLGKDINLIREACRLGEVRLSAQLHMATSADQRASVLAGIYVAAATGTMGALLASNTLQESVYFLIGGVVTATTFIIAAIQCISATLPVELDVPGNDPCEWYKDIEEGTAFEKALGEQMQHFNNHILSNRKVMKDNADRFKRGAMLGIYAPVLGFVFSSISCAIGHFIF